jgi:hypothetical protein
MVSSLPDSNGGGKSGDSLPDKPVKPQTEMGIGLHNNAQNPLSAAPHPKYRQNQTQSVTSYDSTQRKGGAMKSLSVVGTENNHLVLVSEDGERFHVPLSHALTEALRKPVSPQPVVRRVSPRDIQAHIRRGLSAQQVADVTGEDVGYVEKFEGAVVAERAFIAESALRVAVSTNSGENSTFGKSVRARLEEISGSEDAWSAWREESGWQVELMFHEGDVEHKARWSFDPRKHLLEPLNEDATILSRHDPMPKTLIPKLSAVTPAHQPDRFNSEIFETADLGATGPLLEPVPYGRTSQEEGRMADTADLLEVLRKKRGEREPAATEPEDGPRVTHPATGGIRLVDKNEEEGASVTHIGHFDSPDDDPEPPPGAKKKRGEMPSWDEIVFGARGDDDPA